MLHLKMKIKLSTIALAALLFAGLPLASSFAQIGISVAIAPPEIPIYEQPYCPTEGYIWTQGYYGGEWAGETFRYNTAVTRVDTSVIHNTYVNNAVINNTGSRASFNGPGGATAKPTAQEQAAAKAEHVPATPDQRSRVEAAKNNPALHVANNHGKPEAAAIKALDRNSEAQAAGPKKQAGAEKVKGGATHEANGNSAFGHKQGDATTRTKGSQNNAYGKAQSAEAHGSHPAAKGATGPHAIQHEQIVSHRPQPGPGRPGGPAASTHAKGPAAQPDKKNKKPANEGPGAGQ